MVRRFNLTDEFLAMTYPDDYYKSVIEPAKLGKGPIPSKTEMLLKSQPFKAVTLPAREALNPGSVGAFRASGTPLASKVVGAGRFALGGPFGIAALAGQGIGMGVDAIARATNTPEEYEAMKEAARAQGGFGYFDNVDISQDAPTTPALDSPAMSLAEARAAMTQPVDIQLPGARTPITLGAIDPYQESYVDDNSIFTTNIYESPTANQDVLPSEIIGAGPQIFDINQLGDPALNPGSVNAMGIDPFGVNEDLIDRGNPLGDSRVVSEEMGLVGGIPDRGRGMAGPAVEMIGGQAVPVGDILGRQMALEKADFFEEPKSRLDAGGLLSLVGLLTQARPIQAAAMFANRDKIARGIDRAKSGLGSLGDRVSRKMRGVNPDGTTRTQRQYEEAREARRAQKRTDRMIDRISSGKRTRSDPRKAGTTKAQKDAISAAIQDARRGGQYDSGGGSGGGGGKVVCTMMNERYGFGSFRNKIWMKFHESYGPEYQKGYHAIFLPLVKIAKGEGKINTAVRKVLEHMGRHVTADMFKIMKGKKRDPLGRIYRAIFEPTCRIIGKIKSALGRG